MEPRPVVAEAQKSLLPVAGPWITDREIAYATEAASTCWYSGAGTFVRRFEEAFAAHLGRRFAISLPSCTSGLHLALLALDIGPGDEVIVPDVTWIASAAPISYVGATTVFADVDPVTWCIDPASVEQRMTSRTRAVIPVDLYGGMPDMGALEAVTARHGVAIIEDAAEAIGSSLSSGLAGSFGIASAFSFHGSKTLTTGEGGMLVTDDEHLHARAMILRDHGRRPGDTDFRNAEIGWKYKMTDMQAAIGLAQLERLDDLIERKRAIFSWYSQRLADLPGVRLNAEPPGTRNSYWMVTLVADPDRQLDKRRLREVLRERGIDTRPFFDPLTSLDAYATTPQAAGARAANPVSYAVAPWGVNLPSALLLTEEDIARVCDVVVDVLGAS